MDVIRDAVRTQAFEMEYFRFGHGERTMVILPGLSVQSVMGFAESVAASYAGFGSAFTVYTFDRRRTLPAAYPVEDMARDTAAAFSALGLSQTYLFGASQGGMIAMTLAVRYPQLVKKLALGSTAARFPAESGTALADWIRLAEAKDRTGLYTAFGKAIYPAAFFRKAEPVLAEAAKTVTDAELARFCVLADGTRGFDLTGELGRILCPVLAIGARDDAVLGAQATEEIAEILGDRPDFRRHIYAPGYGHAAYDTAPDFRDRLLRFFLTE